MTLTSAEIHPTAIIPRHTDLHVTSDSLTGLLTSASEACAQNVPFADALKTFLIPTFESIASAFRRMQGEGEIVIPKETADIFHALAEGETAQTVQVLGNGQFGRVEKVTIGIFSYAVKTPSSQRYDDETLRVVTRNEQQMMWSLTSDHVISLFGVDSMGRLYMPLASGDVTMLKTLSTPRIYKIAEEMLIGLADIERKRVILRDVKPENVLRIGGRFVHADLGFACFWDDEKAFMGSPMYMSPEAVARKKNQHRSDLWSLGASLFELIEPQKRHLFSAHTVRNYIYCGAPFPTQEVVTGKISALYRDHRVQALDPSGKLHQLLSLLLITDSKSRPGACDILQQLFPQKSLLQTTLPTPPRPGEISFWGTPRTYSTTLDDIPLYREGEIDFWQEGERLQPAGVQALCEKGTTTSLPVKALPLAKAIETLDPLDIAEILARLARLIATPQEGVTLSLETVAYHDGNLYITVGGAEQFADLPPEALTSSARFVTAEGKLKWQFGMITYFALTNSPFRSEEPSRDRESNRITNAIRVALPSDLDPRIQGRDPSGVLRIVMQSMLEELPENRPSLLDIASLLGAVPLLTVPKHRERVHLVKDISRLNAPLFLEKMALLLEKTAIHPTLDLRIDTLYIARGEVCIDVCKKRWSVRHPLEGETPLQRRIYQLGDIIKELNLTGYTNWITSLQHRDPAKRPTPGAILNALAKSRA